MSSTDHPDHTECRGSSQREWMEGWFATRKKHRRKNPWNNHIDNICPLRIETTSVQRPFRPINKLQTADELQPSCLFFHFNIRHQAPVFKHSTNTSLFGHSCFQASCRACPGKRQQDLTRTLVLGPGTLPKLQLLPVMSDDHSVLVFCLQMGRQRTGSNTGVGQGCRQEANVAFLAVNVLILPDCSDWH